MSKVGKKQITNVKIKVNKDDDQTKINELIKNRIYRAREIIIDTTISVQLYRKYGLFSNSEVNICITSLKDLHNKTIETFDKIGLEPVETTIDSLQIIIDKLTTIISTFGTKSVDDLIYMTFGSGFIDYKGEPTIASKFNLIRKYVHPTGFKISSNYINPPTSSNSLCIDKITDDVIVVESSPQFECFVGNSNSASFHNKVHGIKVVLRCEDTKKIMIMSGITDEINLDILENLYIDNRKQNILSRITSCNPEILKNQIEAMTLKDILTSGDSDIVKKNASIVSLSNTTKSDKLDKTLKRFTSLDTFEQRNTLIDLLTCSDDGETEVPVKIYVDEIKVQKDESHSSEIRIDDKVVIKMKYPSLDQFIKNNFDFSQSNESVSTIEKSFDIIADCIEMIFSGEDSWAASDCTKKELIEFIESMDAKQFKMIEQFFETMPKLSHTFTVKNPKTKVENTVTLEGLTSFFG